MTGNVFAIWVIVVIFLLGLFTELMTLNDSNKEPVSLFPLYFNYSSSDLDLYSRVLKEKGNDCNFKDRM